MIRINYNGVLIDADDAPPTVEGSVFHASTGYFESMLVAGGKPQLWELHAARLSRSLEQWQSLLPSGFSAAFLESEITRTIDANEPAPYWKLRAELFVVKDETLQYLIEPITLDETMVAYNEAGLRIGLADNQLKDFDRNANLKTINTTLYVQGPMLAKARRLDDILLVRDNIIVESGTSNLFIVKDGQLVTPPLEAGCIAGVMRTYLMARLSAAGLQVSERLISIADLLNAEEVFLTNAVRRIKWVQSVEDSQFTNHLSSYIYSLLFSGRN